MGDREHGISADVAWIQGKTALLLGGGILRPPLREKQISLPVMGNIEIRVGGQRARQKFVGSANIGYGIGNALPEPYRPHELDVAVVSQGENVVRIELQCLLAKCHDAAQLFRASERSVWTPFHHPIGRQPLSPHAPPQGPLRRL